MGHKVKTVMSKEVINGHIYIYRGSSVKVGICRNKRFQEPVDLASQLNPGHSLGPPDKGSIKRTRTA